MTSQSSDSVPFSTDELQEYWKRLAETYFRHQLPPIRIEWSSRLTGSAGMFVGLAGPRTRCLKPEKKSGTARLIRLSLPLLRDQPESEIIGTLAHEMIHQWQYDVQKRRPDHGKDFLKIMDRMNQDALGITVRHSFDQRVEALSKYSWECRICGKLYHRQRRTISTKRHRCGSCRGPLQEVFLKERVTGEGSTIPLRALPTPENCLCAPRTRDGMQVQLSFEFR